MTMNQLNQFLNDAPNQEDYDFPIWEDEITPYQYEELMNR